MPAPRHRLLGLTVLGGADALTPRQRELLRLAAEGHSTKEIAHLARPRITARGVRSHLSQAYRRLGVSSMREAFKVLGWLSPP